MGAGNSHEVKHARVLRGGSTDVRVLTYNVCWEALEGQRHKRACGTASTGHTFNPCTANIAELICTHLPDIILLQEVREQSDVQWKDGLHAALLHHVPAFDTLYSWTFTTGMEKAGLMTLFNKRKFTLQSVKQGDFLNADNSRVTGRPYLITAFADGLVVANVHFPHMGEVSRDTTRASFLAELRAGIHSLPSVNIEDPKWEVIVGGDFNLDNFVPQVADQNAQTIQRNVAALKRELKGITKLIPGKRMHVPPNAFVTCENQSFDHIFSTIRIPTALYTTLPLSTRDGDATRARMGDLMSDHMPVLATVPWLTKGARADWTDEQEAEELRRNPLPPPPRLDQLPDSALYLVHYTLSNPETWTERQLKRGTTGGVFLTLVTKQNVDKLRTFAGHYRIFLPVNFLTLPNYYINLADQFGTMDQVTTYFPWQLQEAVAKIDEQATMFKKVTSMYLETFNEVVFPDSLQLGDVSTCWRVEKLPGLEWGPLPRTRFVVDASSGCPAQSTQPPVIRISHLGPRAPFVGMTTLDTNRTYPWTRALAGAAGQEAWSHANQFYSAETGKYDLNKLSDKSVPELYANRAQQRLSELHDIVEYEHALSQRQLRGPDAYNKGAAWYTAYKQKEREGAQKSAESQQFFAEQRQHLVTLLHIQDDPTASVAMLLTRWLESLDAPEVKQLLWPTQTLVPIESVLPTSSTAGSMTVTITLENNMGVFQLVVIARDAMDEDMFKENVLVTRKLNPNPENVQTFTNAFLYAVVTDAYALLNNKVQLRETTTHYKPFKMETFQNQFRVKLGRLQTPHGRIQPSTVGFDDGYRTTFRNTLEPAVPGSDVDNFNRMLAESQ